MILIFVSPKLAFEASSFVYHRI